jgi:membrane-associated phospholipid phosphatase
MAALCAALVFFLSPSNGGAQQFTTASATAGNSGYAVAGLRSVSTQPALFTSAPIEDDKQNSPPQTPQKKNTGAPTSFGQFVKNIVHDQAGIWTSPLHIRRHDLLWLIPIAGATAATIPTDARALHAVDPDATYVRATRDFTVTGHPYTLLGAAGATYLLGRATHNEHVKETGALGAEAILNSILVVDALKVLTNRERPDQGNGQGRFWVHGFRDFPHGTAFPSGHAAASWAFARVIAGEYPHRPMVAIVSYSWATLVSVSRVTGRKHYPTDALVGSMVGFLIGDYVHRHRASDREHSSSLTIVPFSDARTRTRGVTVSFSPDLFLGHAHN